MSNRDQRSTTCECPADVVTPLRRHTVTRSYAFCAAHRLHTDHLSPEINRQVFGKCNNANGHGHNYTVHVTVQGDWDIATGSVTDVEVLDRLVKDLVVDRFDHQHLNVDRGFERVVTTGENLAKLIWDILSGRVPRGRLVKVGVVETRDNFFEYAGDPR